MNTRINPFSTKPEQKPVVASNLQTTDVCPVCNTPMMVVRAGSVPAYYCREDRVCLPIKDEV